MTKKYQVSHGITSENIDIRYVNSHSITYWYDISIYQIQNIDTLNIESISPIPRPRGRRRRWEIWRRVPTPPPSGPGLEPLSGGFSAARRGTIKCNFTAAPQAEKERFFCLFQIIIYYAPRGRKGTLLTDVSIHLYPPRVFLFGHTLRSSL